MIGSLEYLIEQLSQLFMMVPIQGSHKTLALYLKLLCYGLGFTHESPSKPNRKKGT